MISVVLWALMCAISPLSGTLTSLLVIQTLPGAAEDPLFSVNTRFIQNNFPSGQVGKSSALFMPGNSPGWHRAFLWLRTCGWQGAFPGLATLNLVPGGGLNDIYPQNSHPAPL